MTTSGIETAGIRATDVRVNRDSLSVDLSDGRTISVPLAWFPRLLHGNMAERANWRLIGIGAGIHWPDLDEDISVEALVAGVGSQESQRSLAAWVESRQKRAPGRKTARNGRRGAGRCKDTARHIAR
ncbi:MAG: DUF2442 domain-containing protein [Deltaproteobacteria bacterium]|nr:DUF2442 domain-containing protein [Deltaproteobacteria bacterium]